MPRSTLSRKARDLNPSKIGAPTALTADDEGCIAEGIEKCAELGFPLTSMDIRKIVKNYLESRGKVEKRFTDNLPGGDWTRKFLARHPRLTVRLSENIKRARVSVTRPMLEKYSENLRESLRGVPVSNIFNYDESNFTDDPGAKMVIVHRRIKHPERVIDYSKTSTSVMISAAADSQLLPPYVVYRATHLYPNRNSSG